MVHHATGTPYSINNQILTSTVGTSTDTYDYNDIGTIVNGFSHLYQASTSWVDDSMVYNEINRLEKVHVTATRTAYYQYDSGGQRVRKVLIDTSTGGTSSSRKYVGNIEEYIEYATSGGTVLHKRQTLHVMDDAARVAQIDTEITPSTGAMLTQNTRYHYSNHIGSSSVELDEGGNLVSFEEYYPYGCTSFHNRDYGTVSWKRYRYVGKERDEETGFYYIGARYYCPWLCRWLADDPIKSAWYDLMHGGQMRLEGMTYEDVGASGYEYCYDNPVRFIDPTGEQGVKGTSGLTLQWDKPMGNPASTPSPLATIPTMSPSQRKESLAKISASHATFRRDHPGLASLGIGTRNFINHNVSSLGYSLSHPLHTVANFLQFTNPYGPLSPQGIENTVNAEKAISATIDKFNGSDKVTKGAMGVEFAWNLTFIWASGESKAATATGDVAKVGDALSFYTVQGVEDAARLRSTGTPWPTAANRGHLGQGVYAWATKEEAVLYSVTKENAEILEYTVEKMTFQILNPKFWKKELKLKDLLINIHTFTERGYHMILTIFRELRTIMALSTILVKTFLTS